MLSFFSKSAYQFFYFIASVAILPPYVLSGAYALKLALSGDGYGSGESRTRDVVVGAAATIYGLWLVYAAGVHYLLMCAVLFAPGIAVYLKARKERGERAFTASRGGACSWHRRARRGGGSAHADGQDQSAMRPSRVPRATQHT